MALARRKLWVGEAELTDRRAIVDRLALSAAILAEAAELEPQSAELRQAVKTILKQALAGGRAEIRRRLEAGLTSAAAVGAYCYLADQLIRALYDHATGTVYPVANPSTAERLSLVAVGGYGRGELAPFSDIDLLCLLPYKETPWSEQVIESLLYMLWDLGLKVGHATRSVDECLRLAGRDLTIRTALLESRYVWGDQPLYLELKERFQASVQAGDGPQFVEAKLAERDERHQRYGDSRYLVEPNVKEGKGGLRDLHTLYWIGKFLYRVDDVAQLIEHGVLSAEEYRTFAKAENFLRTVRCHLHLLAARAEERLTFDRQPELARRLGYADRPGSRGVERFMKHYYLVAKDVGDLTRIFCAALEEQHKRKRRFRFPRIGLRRRELEGFRVEGERLDLKHEDDFETDPVKLIRLFHVAHERDLDVHPHALRQLTRNLRLIDAKLRQDPEANRLFLELLTARRDPETTLRHMNEAGVFGRFVPDFGRIVAQMQHDMYHVYTVDEHTIRAIGVLAKIEDGTFAQDHPLAAELLPSIKSRRALYLAVLLHDIAKGRGGDHSLLGEQVAHRLCPRLGLTADETETVAWLVRWHLAMSATAFKRDLDDPKAIADFVALVQSPERLKLLLILTVADIRAVGPGIWNGWKGQLLRELYWRAEEAMLGGHAARGRTERIHQRQEELRRKLASWPADALARAVARAPDALWLSADAEQVARLLTLMREAEEADRALTVDTRVHSFRAVTEVTVLTGDHAGLFSRLAGAFAVAGANIVDARIFTTNDGIALDIFNVQDIDGRAFEAADQLQRLSRAVERTLAGELKVHDALAKQRGKLPVRAHVFTVEPRVLIDDAASNTHTVIEVNGRDRPGLLHDLTHALFQLSLSISHACIATYGERAVDVFYVKDLFGLKVAHPTKLAQIRERLIAVLQGPERGPAQQRAAE